MPRPTRFALLLPAVAAALLLIGLRGSAAGQPDPTVAEVKAIVPAGDGGFIEVTALVDTAVADPDAVLAVLAPQRATSPGVTAAYALWRKWAPQDVPVVVQYNPTWDPPGLAGKDAMSWSLDQWNAVPSSSFRFNKGPDTDAFASVEVCALQIADATNTVRFSSTLPAGTLGATCTVVSGEQSGIPRVVEFDLQLNATIQWSDAPATPSGFYDLRSTMVHELGHALGLAHTSSSGAAMLPTLGKGTQQRAVTADDRNGVLALYGPDAPTSTPLAYRALGGMLARDIPTPPATPSPTPPPGGFVTFSDGTHMVGVGIAPGTYRTRLDPNSCYWERLRGLSGTPADIIVSSLSNYTQVVTVVATDAAFKSTGCGAWTTDLSAITESPTAGFYAGTYIVGADLAPGTWTAPGGQGCYWARLSGFSGTAGHIAASAKKAISPLVQVLPSDQGFQNHGCGRWQKIQ
ncbi:MAG: matrixin family metalloprotease [Gemmatimonadales bacterium]